MVKQTDGKSLPFFKLGKEQSDAMLGMQKDLLETFEQASRAWLARVKSEVELWSELATKLSATRSAPDAMQVLQQGVAQRMQMAAEDGRTTFRRLSENHEQSRPFPVQRPDNRNHVNRRRRMPSQQPPAQSAAKKPPGGEHATTL